MKTKVSCSICGKDAPEIMLLAGEKAWIIQQGTFNLICPTCNQKEALK